MRIHRSCKITQAYRTPYTQTHCKLCVECIPSYPRRDAPLSSPSHYSPPIWIIKPTASYLMTRKAEHAFVFQCTLFTLFTHNPSSSSSSRKKELTSKIFHVPSTPSPHSQCHPIRFLPPYLPFPTNLLTQYTHSSHIFPHYPIRYLSTLFSERRRKKKNLTIFRIGRQLEGRGVVITHPFPPNPAKSPRKIRFCGGLHWG